MPQRCDTDSLTKKGNTAKFRLLHRAVIFAMNPIVLDCRIKRLQRKSRLLTDSGPECGRPATITANCSDFNQYICAQSCIATERGLRSAGLVRGLVSLETRLYAVSPSFAVS